MRCTLLLALALAACGRRTNVEREGDASYAAGRYAAAAAAYEQVAVPGAPGRVLAKLGQAALRAGEVELAVRAWRRLGEEDPSSRIEAADGLELAMRAAERSGREEAGRVAAQALRAIAPERPVGRVGEAEGWGRAGRDELVLQLAAATEPRVVDSLLLAYGERAETDGDWETALGAYRGVVRRGEPGMVQLGRIGVAATATRLGARSLGEGQPAEAVQYFREALAADPTAAGDSAMAGLARALAGVSDTTTTAPRDSAGTGTREITQ
jgi:tetratricopeptide (TPR) repeat protein